MTDAELERQRKLLHEAFTAGWQAALAVKVTNPSVLAVVESCFELWLEEEVDERGVLGLPFRRRYDLPRPRRNHLLRGWPDQGRPPSRRTPAAAAATEPVQPVSEAATGEVGVQEPSAPTLSVVTELPRQRDASESDHRTVETSRTGS